MPTKPIIQDEKPVYERLQEKRNAQNEADASMVKTAPDAPQTPGTAPSNPMDAALPAMTAAQFELEQIMQLSRQKYNTINEAKTGGNFSKFLDSSVSMNPESWEKVASDLQSIKKKMLTVLPLI